MAPLLGLGHPRRPALGGALRPTREDAQLSQDAVFEYSQRLSQQVVALEAENVELQDARARLAAENHRLAERANALELDNTGLRDSGTATFQERQLAVAQAHEAVRNKHGEVMLLRNTSEQQKQRAESLGADNQRFRGINERLQAERLQLERTVLGLEATTNAMQAEMHEQAAVEARSAGICGNLERHVNALTQEKRRLDEQAGIRYVEAAHLRHAREELASERARAHHLGEELRGVLAEVARLRAEAVGLAEAEGALRNEAAQQRLRESAAVAEQPRLCEALQREGAAAEALRGRIAELEALIGSLRRGQTTVEAENASLRTALAAAKAEAQRCLGDSAQLVAAKCGAEQQADQEGACRREAERRLAAAAAEGAQHRQRADALRAESGNSAQRLLKFEAENAMLRGQLRGSAVLTKGLREECQALSVRVQHHQLGSPESPLPPPSAAPSPGAPHGVGAGLARLEAHPPWAPRPQGLAPPGDHRWG